MSSPFFQFIKSKTFLKHLLIAIGLVLVLLIITFQSLRVYTHHGEAFTVPDFTGLSIEESQKLASEKSFEILVIDSLFDSDKEKGAVVDQTPRANSKVKEGRTIFLTINAFSSERVMIPNFTGVSLRQAIVMAETYGLKIGKLSYVPDLAANNVLEQKHKGKKIKTGEYILKGATIDLVLGRGLGDEKAFTPLLIKLTKDQAIAKLQESFLNTGKIIFDETVKTKKDSAKALVYKQQPMYSRTQEIDFGQSVNIWLTIDESQIPEIDTTSVDTEINEDDE